MFKSSALTDTFFKNFRRNTMKYKVRESKVIDKYFDKTTNFWVVSVTYSNGSKKRKSFHAESTAHSYKTACEMQK